LQTEQELQNDFENRFRNNKYNKEKLIVKSPYSLHTEPSSVPKTFNSKIVKEFKHIKKAQRGNIPQLWYDKEWANEFFYILNG
jgi:hypothetical protein